MKKTLIMALLATLLACSTKPAATGKRTALASAEKALELIALTEKLNAIGAEAQIKLAPIQVKIDAIVTKEMKAKLTPLQTESQAIINAAQAKQAPLQARMQEILKTECAKARFDIARCSLEFRDTTTGGVRTDAAGKPSPIVIESPVPEPPKPEAKK